MTSDAEIITLAVVQALLGYTSETRWIRRLRTDTDLRDQSTLLGGFPLALRILTTSLPTLMPPWPRWNSGRIVG